MARPITNENELLAARLRESAIDGQAAFRVAVINKIPALILICQSERRPPSGEEVQSVPKKELHHAQQKQHAGRQRTPPADLAKRGYARESQETSRAGYVVWIKVRIEVRSEGNDRERQQDPYEARLAQGRQKRGHGQ